MNQYQYIIVRFLFIVVFFFSNAHAQNWIDSKEYDGVVYFLFDSPGNIKRFDMRAELFMDDLILLEMNDKVTAFDVDSDGIYVAYGKQTLRYTLDGTSTIRLGKSDHDISTVLANDSHIYVNHADDLTSIDKVSCEVVETKDFYYNMVGLSLSRANEKLYARSTGVSPSDILYIDISSDGTLQGMRQHDSPYHGDFPTALKTYLFPNESEVADDSGIIYTTKDLNYGSSLAGGFEDLSFYGDLPIVLRENRLILYTSATIEAGVYEYTGVEVKKISVYGDSVFGYYIDAASNIQTVKTDISLIAPALPGEPVDPEGLQYKPDSIVVGSGGIAYILSKEHENVFRWSIEENQYLSSIPLLGAPEYMTYSTENNSLYFAYHSGEITKLDVDLSQAEEGFYNLPQHPKGLTTAGEYVFAVDPSGAWDSHYTFSPQGQLLSVKDWNYFSREYVWNASSRKMYFLRDNTSPNDLIWEEISLDGIIGARQDSPYHSSNGIKHPIRVSTDGSRVLLGSGRIYDGISLELLHTLPNEIVDAVWHGDGLQTLGLSATQTILQEWDIDTGYSKSSELIFDGIPIFMLHSQINGQRWLSLISEIDGIPTFRPIEMNGSLDVDGDGIINALDNCPSHPNPDQKPSGNNAKGDACYTDEIASSSNANEGDQIRALSTNIKFGGRECRVVTEGSDDDFLLMLVPSIIAATQNVRPAEWGVVNGICCPTSSAVFRITQGGKTLSSTSPSCSREPSFSGYLESDPGEKSFRATISAETCGTISFQPFNYTFRRNTRYLFVSDFVDNNPVIKVLSGDRDLNSSVNSKIEVGAKQLVELIDGLPIELERSSDLDNRNFQKSNHNGSLELAE